MVLVLPSASGSIQMEVEPDRAAEAQRATSLARILRPEVEALVARAMGGRAFELYLAPIDVCYALVATVREKWRGLDGGSELRSEVACFFERLAARAEPDSERRDLGEERRPAMTFEPLREIADAVLLEGHVPYPYRSTSAQTRYRFTFGVLFPPTYALVEPSERSWLEAQVLMEGSRPHVKGRLRFLAVERRALEASVDGAFRPVESLEVDGRPFVSFDEGQLEEVDFEILLDRRDERPREREIRFSFRPHQAVEVILDARGTVVGRMRRDRQALYGRLRLRGEPILEEAGALTRLTIRVENLSPADEPPASRQEATRAALASTHLLLSARAGRFCSLRDPPPFSARAAAACQNIGTYPVLADPGGRSAHMLFAPIILDEPPRIAPERPMNLFDASEIDELLALRTMTLADRERPFVRATDPRAEALLDQVSRLGPEAWAKLHGAPRSPEDEPRALARRLEVGDKVRLRPKRQRSDAQDVLLAGRTATIEAVRQDVDGQEYLAVTIDEDPAAELHRWKGGFHYYRIDELEPLEGGSS